MDNKTGNTLIEQWISTTRWPQLTAKKRERERFFLFESKPLEDKPTRLAKMLA